MIQIYAVHDPASDKLVGIYGTNKTVDDERHKMLATLEKPGEFWHKEAQKRPELWLQPASLHFVVLEDSTSGHDRRRLVDKWRKERFLEARRIVTQQARQPASCEPPASDATALTGPAFVAAVEKWAELTSQLFGGENKRILDLSESDRKHLTRILSRQVGSTEACELPQRFFNLLNNYDMVAYSPESTPMPPDGEVPF